MDDPRDLTIDNWALKVRVPYGAGPHPVIFLIHGWTGDEKSMWVFASRLPRTALLIAPRAPYVSRHPEFAGFSWVPERGESFSSLDKFRPALDSFQDLIPKLASELPGDFDNFGMVGFSQGAAFSYSYAMRNSDRVSRLAALAGFLPLAGSPLAESGSQIAELTGIPILIAHGIQDETVPIAMAREARKSLESIGVKVSYCESETSHKLGANCARQLADFFAI